MNQEATPVTVSVPKVRRIGRTSVRPIRRVVLARIAVLADLVIPAAIICWVTAAGITLWWPDHALWYSTVQVGFGTGGMGILILLLAFAGLARPAIGIRLCHVGPWLLVLGVQAAAWQLTTAKLALFPLPYFPPPQAIIDAFAALLIMAILFSGLITLLFRMRNRVLAWQKGLVRW